MSIRGYARIHEPDFHRPSTTPKANPYTKPSSNNHSKVATHHDPEMQSQKKSNISKPPTTNTPQNTKVAMKHDPQPGNQPKPSSANFSGGTKTTNQSMAKTIASTGADFIPVAGNVKSGVEVISGKDYITGKELSTGDRVIAGFGILGGGVAKGIVKGVAKGVGKAVNAITHQDEIGKVSKGSVKTDIEVTIPSNKYPETSKHIQEAQRAGHPDILTIDRAGAKLRRNENLSGFDKVPGKDLDEYPPAMFKEGGKGASVRPVSQSDNRGAGAYLGNKLRNYPDGTKVRLK